MAKYWENLSEKRKAEIREQIKRQNEYDAHMNEYELWCRLEHATKKLEHATKKKQEKENE